MEKLDKYFLHLFFSCVFFVLLYKSACFLRKFIGRCFLFRRNEVRNEDKERMSFLRYHFCS